MLLFKRSSEFFSINDRDIYGQARYCYPCFGGEKAAFCYQFGKVFFRFSCQRVFLATERQQDRENLRKTIKYLNHKVNDDDEVEDQPTDSFQVAFFCFWAHEQHFLSNVSMVVVAGKCIGHLNRILLFWEQSVKAILRLIAPKPVIIWIFYWYFLDVLV